MHADMTEVRRLKAVHADYLTAHHPDMFVLYKLQRV